MADTSSEYSSDAPSFGDDGDAPVADCSSTTDRVCRWCRRELPTTDPRAVYCSTRCRQTAFRLRRRAALDDAPVTPGTFCYADPPYPGLSKRYYGREATYAGEVDHAALIASLEASKYAGWALSTWARALREVLPLCPPTARVCAWMKPHGIPAKRSRGMHNVWEALIVVTSRRLRPAVPDALRALPARGGGELPGRKPLAFAAWLFECLGMRPGDELVDLYPGTGVIGRAWASLSSMHRGNGGDRG